MLTKSIPAFMEKDILNYTDEDWKEKKEYENSLRMYVVVRRDILPLPHCVPQSCHAVAEFMDLYRDRPVVQRWVKEDKTMIVLQAKNEARFNEAISIMKQRNKVFHAFREPDMGDVETAVTFEPIPFILGKELFKDYTLLK